jgi:putative membrane protein
MKFLLRLLITAAALWVAVQIIPGIDFTGSTVQLLGVALVFGAVNAVIRPILLLLSCPCVLITLGLFIFVVNAAMLWLTSVLSRAFNWGFTVSGFWAALFGGLVVGIVSTALNILLGDRATNDKSKRQAPPPYGREIGGGEPPRSPGA